MSNDVGTTGHLVWYKSQSSPIEYSLREMKHLPKNKLDTHGIVSFAPSTGWKRKTVVCPS